MHCPNPSPYDLLAKINSGIIQMPTSCVAVYCCLSASNIICLSTPWTNFCLPCIATNIATGHLAFPNLSLLPSSTFYPSPYSVPEEKMSPAPPVHTLVHSHPQPIRLLSISSISITEGLIRCGKFAEPYSQSAPQGRSTSFRLF